MSSQFLEDGATEVTTVDGSSIIYAVSDPTGSPADEYATKDNFLKEYLQLAGGTMTGAIAMGTNKITGLGDPTAAQDAATKNYVDTLPLDGLGDVSAHTPTKGHLLIADGDSWEVLSVGTDDQVLIADSAQTLGVKWGSAGAADNLGNHIAEQDLDMAGFNIDAIDSLYLSEKAAANADIGDDGQIWVKAGAPNTLFFTDDAGTDFQIATLTGTETLTNKTIDTASNTVTLDMGEGTLTGTAAQFDTACSDDDFAFVSDNLSVFAATTSAQLAGVISDETGSGALVFATSPTLATPVLGTPTSGTLTNCTGLPIDTGLATGTKANLESVLSDVSDIAEADGDTYTGTHDFSSATITLPANSVDSDQYVDGSIDDAHLSTTEDAMLADIVLILDGGGSAITTGIKADIQVDFNCTIEQVTMLADQSTSTVVDIWKDTYANFPATNADSITASAVPTITTATKSQDSTLTGWTTTITAGDHLRYNVDSNDNATRCTIALKVRKT